MTDLKSQIEQTLAAALALRRGFLARTSAAQKNRGLLAMADEIMLPAPSILEANAKDVAKATADGLSKAMLDRLTLDAKRLEAMADGIRGSRQAARSRGRNPPRLDAPQRPAHLEGARAHRCCGDYLRITPECDQRCRRALHEDRKCHDPARRRSESIHSNVAIAAALGRGTRRARTCPRTACSSSPPPTARR